MQPLEIIESKTPQSASALEQYERAQLKTAMDVAREFDRPSLKELQNKLMSLVTTDTETAEACFYSLRRKSKEGGEKVIRGPSVRLAELATMIYGNLKFGSRVIGSDGQTITAQGVCTDLQTNNTACLEVKRRITDKFGKTFNEDMQVVTGNAACAIALRNAIFKIVPGVLVTPVYEQAIRVAVGDAKTLSSRRLTAVEKLSKMGVSKERVLAVLERSSVEEITLDDLEVLTSLRTEIRDELKTIDEAFPIVAPPPKPTFAQRHQSKAPPPPPPEKPGDPLFDSSAPPEPPTSSAPSAISLDDAHNVHGDAPGNADSLEQESGQDAPLDLDAPDAIIMLEGMMAKQEISEEMLMAYCRRTSPPMATKKQEHLRELSTTKLLRLIQDFGQIAKEILDV